MRGGAFRKSRLCFHMTIYLRTLRTRHSFSQLVTWSLSEEMNKSVGKSVMFLS
jgi:hypothetical protein